MLFISLLYSSVMADFRDGKTTVLIATNVIARGIDVPAVTLVVNFEIPVNKYHKPDYEVSDMLACWCYDEWGQHIVLDVMTL